MELIKAPTAKDDCRDLWKPVAKAVGYLNALGNKLTIIYDEQGNTDGLQLTEGNATLTIKSGGAGGGTGRWYAVNVAGLRAYAKISSTTPVSVIPDDVVVVNLP